MRKGTSPKETALSRDINKTVPDQRNDCHVRSGRGYLGGWNVWFVTVVRRQCFGMRTYGIVFPT